MRILQVCAEIFPLLKTGGLADVAGALALAWDTRSGEWTARLRGASRQDRVDASVLTGSGLDARRTPGFGVLDLGWSRQFGAHRLRLDLKNVFDRTYAEHLNRANLDGLGGESGRCSAAPRDGPCGRPRPSSRWRSPAIWSAAWCRGSRPRRRTW